MFEGIVFSGTARAARNGILDPRGNQTADLETTKRGVASY